MEVDGSLIAAGTATDPVTFTSMNDNSVGGATNGIAAGGRLGWDRPVWRGHFPPREHQHQVRLHRTVSAYSAGGVFHGSVATSAFGVARR